MVKQNLKPIISLDEFDETVSLWQLLPCGAGRGLKRLKIIVDSILNSQLEPTLKPLSLLIAGKQATRSHARSFLRALGFEYPCEYPAHYLQTTNNDIYQFFSPTQLCDSHIISSITAFCPAYLKTVYEVITTGQYIVSNFNKKTIELVPVIKPLIMTTHHLGNVPDYFKEKIDHIIELENYTEQQLQLIILQRLKYSNINYEEEKVLQLVVAYGIEILHQMIRLLKSAITNMLADNRTTLTVDDVKMVMSLS